NGKNPFLCTMKSLFSAILILLIATTCIGQDAIDTSKVYMMAEQMPQFKGGVDSLGKYISTHTFNPHSKEGTVYINFVVTRTGKVINPKILKGVANAPELDSAAMACIAGMPDWIPGKQNGVPVNVYCNLPFRFVKPAQNKNTDSVIISFNIVKGDTIYTSTEEMPTMKEGSLYDYVQAHIQYPEQENEHNIAGTAVTTFIIEKDGSISHVKVISEIPDGPEMNQEAARVINTMPNWNPGKHNGRPVRVKYNFPVGFSYLKGKYYSVKDSMYIDYLHARDTDKIYTTADKEPAFPDTIKPYQAIRFKYTGNSIMSRRKT